MVDFDGALIGHVRVAEQQPVEGVTLQDRPFVVEPRLQAGRLQRQLVERHGLLRVQAVEGAVGLVNDLDAETRRVELGDRLDVGRTVPVVDADAGAQRAGGGVAGAFELNDDLADFVAIHVGDDRHAFTLDFATEQADETAEVAAPGDELRPEAAYIGRFAVLAGKHQLRPVVEIHVADLGQTRRIAIAGVLVAHDVTAIAARENDQHAAFVRRFEAGDHVGDAFAGQVEVGADAAAAEGIPAIAQVGFQRQRRAAG